MKVPLLTKEKFASDTYGLYFDRSLYPYDFLPGQYVTVTVPHAITDGNGASRDFTIASSPTDKEHLLLVTKEGITQAKRALTNLDKGQDVDISQPAGGFYLSQANSTPLVLLAGGIGMTPFYSMVRFYVAKKLTFPLTLLVSFSKQEDMLFYSELVDTTKNVKQIQVVYTISEAKDNWRGEKGRISTALIKKYVPDVTKRIFLVAGSPEMTDATEGLLMQMGILPENIKIDSFPGY